MQGHATLVYLEEYTFQRKCTAVMDVGEGLHILTTTTSKSSSYISGIHHTILVHSSLNFAKWLHK